MTLWLHSKIQQLDLRNQHLDTRHLLQDSNTIHLAEYATTEFDKHLKQVKFRNDENIAELSESNCEINLENCTN